MHVVTYKLLTIAGIFLLSPAWVPAPRTQQSLTISAVRFYRPTLRQTQVKAFVQIPHAMLAPSTDRAAGQLTYKVTVKVKDSTGLELVQNEWSGHAPAAARQAGASSLEILDFALAPGLYRLEVAVVDSLSGRRLASDLQLEGFRGGTDVSDLLLTPGIRPAVTQDTVPMPGEIRKGNLLITGTAELILTPLRSRVHYLLETYNAEEDTAKVAVVVQDSSDKVIVSTRPSSAALPAGGSVLTGTVDLAGLPAGDYTLRTQLTMNGGSVERSAAFTMAGLSETIAKDAQRRQADRVTDEGYFASMTNEELDRAEVPLSLIAKPNELSVYNDKLSVAAKQRFLTDFWRKRDPTPATPQNEEREQFYAAIAYVNRTYRESGRNTTEGWRTDRGRIYAKNGVPDEIFRRHQQGYAPPYEVWRYSTGKGRYYIFADRTGFGGFKLLSSNDLQEVGDPNWQRVLGVPALEDIARVLNLDRIELDRGGGLR
jgi:GWxTD domain-containing protein